MPGLGLFSATLRGEAGIYLGLLISLVGTLFSAYLTYLEVFVIHALCQWCLASLFTGVLRRGILRSWTSTLRSSEKFGSQAPRR
jgi:uncharacterized membrane protein